MEFTKQDLANLSNLARISVATEEEEGMLRDMQAILNYVAELNREASGINGSDRGRGRDVAYNVVREDKVTHEPGSNTETLLQEAPEVEDGYVKVSQVLK